MIQVADADARSGRALPRRAPRGRTARRRDQRAPRPYRPAGRSTTSTGRCRSADLVALYLAGDVMLVTPLRDGMNLVAKEYVAARRDVNGVLVLSEFAGAADELIDAVLVNPHDDQALRDAIVTAVEMRHGERTARMAAAARRRRPQRRAGLGRALPRRARRRGADPRDRPTATLPISGSTILPLVADGSPPSPGPLLVGLDVDGVLAPIVGHAADAALAPGHARRARRPRRPHARSASCRAAPVGDLARFGFPDVDHGRRQPRRRAAGPAPAPAHAERVDAARPAARRSPSGRRGGRSRRLGRVRSRRASCSTCAGPTRTASVPSPRSWRARRCGIGGTDVKRGHSVVELAPARPARRPRSPTMRASRAPRRSSSSVTT